MGQYAMIIDSNRCVSCFACRVACQLQNDLPPELSRIRFTEQEKGVFPDTRVLVLPTQCMHCDDPPCVEVCPTGASFKREDGLVLIDYEKCIGCQYCVSACPYSARSYNPRTKTVDKCTFCAPRLAQGQGPACVEACITGARIFGKVDEEGSPVQALLKDQRTNQVKGTSMYYRVGEKWLDEIPADAYRPAYASRLVTRQPVGTALLGLSAGAVAASFVLTRVRRSGEEDHDEKD